MQLSSKLKTLLMMGVKAAGSYNAMNALPPIEEQMTSREFATAAAFLSWVVANQLTFGRGNIHERFQQFLASHSTLPAKRPS